LHRRPDVPTSTGFIAQFSGELDSGVLNLYDTENEGFGVADAVLQGTASGPINGTLIVDSSLRQITFIKTGSLLAADSYTVTLRSAADGFKDVAGGFLDGDGDGAQVGTSLARSSSQPRQPGR
jgi:hypothetical protein